MISSLNLHIEEGDEPSGDLSASIAILHLNGQGLRAPRLISNPTATAAAYLRRLATEAEKLADAIEARRAEPTGPPYPPGDIGLTARLRLAEAAGSTAGETRDVPTPGAAT